MLGYVLSGLGGGLAGCVVNLLADKLPPLAAESEGHGSEEETELAQCPTPSQVGLPLARYIAIEILLILAGLYLWSYAGLTPLLGSLAFYVSLFTLIAVIDIEHRLVLNIVMLPAFVIALLEVLLSARIKFREALVGYALAQIIVMGFFLLGAVYLWLINTVRKTSVSEVAFGFGDVTLATFCGLIVGENAVLPMLILMVLIGGLIAVLYLFYRLLTQRGYKAHTPLPYSPSIVLAAMIMLLWGERFTMWQLWAR